MCRTLRSLEGHYDRSRDGSTASRIATSGPHAGRMKHLSTRVSQPDRSVPKGDTMRLLAAASTAFVCLRLLMTRRWLDELPRQVDIAIDFPEVLP
ncbi:MAG: hypothetical protein EOP66_04825 [Sphingomonas sp.]|nr:MAG: hypothetical protein EOP66_04825 [Sphingomonas sp.]